MDSVQSRVRAALELSELVVALQRQRLARAHPEEGPERIAARLQEWLLRPDPAVRRASAVRR